MTAIVFAIYTHYMRRHVIIYELQQHTSIHKKNETKHPNNSRMELQYVSIKLQNLFSSNTIAVVSGARLLSTLLRAFQVFIRSHIIEHRACFYL